MKSDYEEDYFENIKRYAPFSFIYPLAKRVKTINYLALKLIQLKEILFAKRRAKFITRYHPKKVLDVGCGKGELVGQLNEIGIEAYGVDISNFAINNANESIRSKIKVASAENLPFKNKEFEVVCAFALLEHLRKNQIERALKEFTRISSQYILLQFPTKENFFINTDPTHISKLSIREWENVFRTNLPKKWAFKRIRTYPGFASEYELKFIN